MYPEYFERVVPSGQDFNDEKYCGIFHFRFWRYGIWYDVVVDDKLPINKQTNELLFCKNAKHPDEMIYPLIEKAYAKLFLCYEFLIAGDAVDAMIDMTGGIHQSLDINSISRMGLWDQFSTSFMCKSLCVTVCKTNKYEDITPSNISYLNSNYNSRHMYIYI